MIRGSGDPTRVALCPMDEVGYVVGAITPEGYLTLRRVGATSMGPLYDQFLEGQRVTVFGRRGPLPGVVGVRSIHLTRGRPSATEEPFNLDNAYVDVGATSPPGVGALGVGLLAPVTRAKRAHRYGTDLVAALDVAARASCAALLDAARRPARAAGRHRRGRVHPAAAPPVGRRLVRARSTRAARRQGADVVLLGETAPADSLGLGAAPARRDTLPAARGLAATAWSLPTRYARTPVETVSLRDVAALADRLRPFLGGVP